MPEALPAVTRPPSLRNAGRILASVSAVVSGLTCSSRSKNTLPFLEAISTGTICSLKRPSAVAAAARRWLSAASWSIISRVMPNSSATFSAVPPMCRPFENGSCRICSM